LFPTILLVFGKVNFTNLSRYSDICEKTYRRHYAQPFNFPALNAQLIAAAIPASRPQIAAIDCSFIPKSGKKTYGVDWFYNGSASRTEKGLEISVIAVIDVNAHQGYTLSVQQTPPQAPELANSDVQQQPKKSKAKAKAKAKAQAKAQAKAKRKQTKQVSQPALDAAIAAPQQLPPESPSVPPGDQTEPLSPVVSAVITRIDHYVTHLQNTQTYFPSWLKYLVCDGFYSKLKFVDGVVALDLHLISKLRIDADLRYLYDGPQKKRGRPRKYDGKVVLSDMTRFTWVKEVAPQVHLYTILVWHVTLKRKIRLAYLLDQSNPAKPGGVLLFSTDTTLDAEAIVTYYGARFQIEFIFRDAKQFTGLGDAQTRDAKKLDFHFNASLSALNLAKYDALCPSLLDSSPLQPISFSIMSAKRLALNDHLLERFIAKLELDPTLIKSHPNYENLRSYGVIAA
jgi:hypothetical protein